MERQTRTANVVSPGARGERRITSDARVDGQELVAKVSATLNNVCEIFAQISGFPVNPLTREVLAKRIMASVESGETDPARWKAAALGGFARRLEINEPKEGNG